MKKRNLILQYSIVAVAAISLAACGSDRDRVARNDKIGSQTPQNTTTGMGDTSSADRATGGTLSSGDRDFITKAAQGGMAEVEMARLAEQKATNPRVKEYAHHLITDHTKANDELKSIAANNNLTVPADLASGDRSELDKLNKLSGAKFDREFVKHAVNDHKDDIKDFEKEADKGADPAVKHFASNTLPTLRNHLEMAQKIDNHHNDADRSIR